MAFTLLILYAIGVIIHIYAKNAYNLYPVSSYIMLNMSLTNAMAVHFTRHLLCDFRKKIS